MDIAKMIKNYREKSGLTQEQISSKLFISRSTYTNYENGKRSVDAATFFKIIELLGVEISLKEKEHYEWTLSYIDKEPGEKEPVILNIYEEDGLFSLEVFECIDGEKGTLLMVNSSVSAQGEKLTKSSIDWIVENEIKEDYAIEKVEYLTFDDVVMPSFSKGNLYAWSISMIERYIRKMLWDKYKKEFIFSFSFDPEWGVPECSFGVDDDTNVILMALLKEVDLDIYEEVLLEIEDLEKVIRSDSLEGLRMAVKYRKDARTARKQGGETEEDYKKRLLEEIEGLKYSSHFFEEFREGVAELLLEKMLGKKIVTYQIDAIYSDLIYVKTK